jgi:taurine dioxygenase
MSEHIAFAERWGDINVNRFFAAHPGYPQIAMVTKEPDQKLNIGGGWHTDHSYDANPALGSILVARELPNRGGETWFASMYKAYDALSDGLKQTLHGLSAVHSARHRFGTDHRYDREDATEGRIGNAEAADRLEDVIHPVVIRHPLSGKPALYVNPDFTIRFDGWSAEDSEPLLQHLYNVAVTESFITRFHLEPGSIAFWDNRATWHQAQNDYHGERREMHRITIEGCPLSAYR